MAFDAAGGGALEKNFNIPSFLVNWSVLSSSEGTEDSSEDSSELILSLVVGDDGVGCSVRKIEVKKLGKLWRSGMGKQQETVKLYWV